MLKKLMLLSLLFALPTFAQTTSNAVPFTVNVPQVTSVLTTVAPSSANLGAPPVTITIAGTGFVSSSVAFFDKTALTTTFVSATQLTAVVPTALLTVAPGSPCPSSIAGACQQHPVTVQNPISVANVLLQWQSSPTPNISGYLVRRDGTLLTSNPLASLSYDDIAVPSGSHSWAVTAVLGGVESLPASVSLTL